MLIYDLKNFKLVYVSTLSSVVMLLKPNEIPQLIKFFKYTNEIFGNFFITDKHYKTMLKKYTNNITNNVNHYLTLQYLKYSLYKCNNKELLTNLLIKFHFNNKSLNTQFTIPSSYQNEALAA